MNSTLPAPRVMIRSDGNWNEYIVLGQLGELVFLAPFWRYETVHPDLWPIELPEGLAEALGTPETIYRISRPALSQLFWEGDAAWHGVSLSARHRLRYWLKERVCWWVTLLRTFVASRAIR